MNYGGDYLGDAILVETQYQAAAAAAAVEQQAASTQFGSLAAAVAGGIPVAVSGQYQDGTIAGDGVYIVVNIVGSVITVTFSPGALNLKTLATVKCNTAAVAPGVNDDATAGFSRFSQWIDTALDDIYICANPVAGAAVWRKVN